MPDSLVREITIPVPVAGLWDNYDPGTADYPDEAAPRLVNIRTSEGKWQTRRGQTLWQSLPGSGNIRMLAAHYHADGTRVRLTARGNGGAAVLYKLQEGSNTIFTAATGGSSLGGVTHHRFQGVTLNDRFYLTDRAGPLRKFQLGIATEVSAVALPAKPSAAPLVKARTYDFLEVWAGAAPFGWTETDDTGFALEDGTAANPGAVAAGLDSPLGGVTACLDTKTNPKLKPITDNVSGEAIPSNTIATWVYNTDLPSKAQFRYGLVTATDFSVSMDMPLKATWLPLFINVGALGTINFKQFNVFENTDAADIYLSRIALPGRLQGLYRWIYTHYDPVTGRESEPSDVSNGGTPLDLSLIGTTGQAATAAAFQKSAALTFTADADAATTEIRVYRNGGVPSLTVDGNGRSVWFRVGTIADFATTLTNSPAAGATTFTVASGGTAPADISVGDWLVLNKGTVGSEEFVRVTNIASLTITVSRGLEFAHTSGQAVQVAFVDNVPNEQVDTSATIDLERDDPPAAARFVQRSPDGRLWIFNYSGKPTGVAVSNRATPERTTDYEVFPDGVDPLTRQSLLQGWRFEIGGDVNDEEIVWGGFFHGEACVLTRERLYRIHAYSQQDWGPSAVDPALEVGCIAGDTVVEIAGWLYWMATGPRLMRWNGVDPPEDVTYQRAEECLSKDESDPASWPLWFAVGHRVRGGTFYRLYFRSAEAPAEPGAPISMFAFWIGGAGTAA